jgi:acetyl esterase/lipase
MENRSLIMAVFIYGLSLISVGVIYSQEKVDSNVVFGMYSGLALLMDVRYPESPNGYGVIIIKGSGWHTDFGYDARQLKAPRSAWADIIEALLDAGYTLFDINHRAAPRFRYPAAVEDAQRAVRYVRHNAKKFAIEATNIGAFGGSSGGHLVCLLGVLDGYGNPADPDSVNHTSSKVQCVVAWFPVTDIRRRIESATTTSFMGMRLSRRDSSSQIHLKYVAASPISYATSDDAPLLMVHGDADPVVPFEQSQLMYEELYKAGVEVKLLPVPGGGHGVRFRGATNPPDYIQETVQWLDLYLKRK